jgi:membrane associated rhomboid family serine protease
MSENPTIGPPAQTLIWLGAKDFTAIQRGEIWRLLMPTFLHDGVLHLAVNLVAQIRLALPLEIKWGSRKFVLVYLGAGINGAAWSCFTQPELAGVGASAALFGLLGAWIVDILCCWHTAPPETRGVVLCQAVLLSLLGIGSSFSMPLVDAGSHLGGYLMGMLVAVAHGTAWSPDDKESPKPVWRFIRYVVAGSVPMAPIAGLLLAEMRAS